LYGIEAELSLWSLNSINIQLVPYGVNSNIAVRVSFVQIVYL